MGFPIGVIWFLSIVSAIFNMSWSVIFFSLYAVMFTILLLDRHTQVQQLQIIQFYYQNNHSPIATFHALLPFYGRNNHPPELAIRWIVENFECMFSLHNIQVPIREKTARRNENIAAVQASVATDCNLSIPRRYQELGLSPTTTWRILKKDLGLYPYKIVLTQELKPLDHRKCREFADFALEQLENDNDFFKKIIFLVEVHFHLSGAINKYRFWCEENDSTRIKDHTKLSS